MAISEYAGTATIGTTEYSLPNNSITLTPMAVAGVYQAWIDFGAVAAGDQFEVKLYETVVSGGTQQLAESWLIADAQSTPARPIPSAILMHGWDLTVKKIAGTDRSISWSIRYVP